MCVILQDSIKKEEVNNISSIYGYHVLIKQMYTLCDTQLKGNIHFLKHL